MPSMSEANTVKLQREVRMETDRVKGRHTRDEKCNEQSEEET